MLKQLLPVISLTALVLGGFSAPTLAQNSKQTMLRFADIAYTSGQSNLRNSPCGEIVATLPTETYLVRTGGLEQFLDTYNFGERNTAEMK